MAKLQRKTTTALACVGEVAGRGVFVETKATISARCAVIGAIFEIVIGIAVQPFAIAAAMVDISGQLDVVVDEPRTGEIEHRHLIQRLIGQSEDRFAAALEKRHRHQFVADQIVVGMGQA